MRRFCGRRLPTAPDVGPGVLADDGFDMHFTAGLKGIGGWTRYNALHSTIDKTYQSAVLLADAMQKAKGTLKVQWISVYDGSTILTQAMKILVDRGVTLENHKVFLCNPKTSPNQAVRLAHKLQLEVNQNFSEIGIDPVGAWSSARSARARIGNEFDKYGWQHCIGDGTSGVLKTLGLLGAGAFAVGQAGPAVLALSGVVAAVGNASTAASAFESAGKLVKQIYDANRHKLPARK